jgi:O-succinylbenzoic acid--CoA ligase
MEEKELRHLILMRSEWSIPQLQEKLALALEGSGPALSTIDVSTKKIDKSIALLVTTTGSTGSPKSVAITSAALTASINASNNYLGATIGNTWSLLLPTNHIAGLNVIFRATALGTNVIDNRKVKNYINSDFISIVPSQLHRAVTTDSRLLEHLKAAKAVLVGGSPITDAMKIKAAEMKIRIVTTYGMTEMCGGCVYNNKPLDGVALRITREGFIQLSGPMMALGYLSLSGEIIPISKGNWFESDDFGEISNGNLNVLGKANDIIISGGEKISLPLIEEMISRFYPDHDLIAFAMDDEFWGQQLCLGCTSEILIDELRNRLGPILTPKKIYLFDQIPKTAIGKLDRKIAVEIAKKIKIIDD